MNNVRWHRIGIGLDRDGLGLIGLWLGMMGYDGIQPQGTSVPYNVMYHLLSSYIIILLESNSTNEVDQSPLLHWSGGHCNECAKNRPTMENARPAECQFHHGLYRRNGHMTLIQGKSFPFVSSILTVLQGNADNQHERLRPDHRCDK